MHLTTDAKLRNPQKRQLSKEQAPKKGAREFPVKRKATYRDYRQMPEERKCELIAGEIIMSPSANYFHQRVAATVFRALDDFARAHRNGIALYEFDVYLSPEDVFRPDVMFISNARLKNITTPNLRGVPDLAVEVLSPSNKRTDTVVKKQRYARYGLPHYWRADPKKKTLEVYRLISGTFALEKVYGAGETLTTVLGGASLRLLTGDRFETEAK